ncbi:BNR-4 repeat-containing protein [Cohnella fermenti]|uniref:LamG-like jellyroll fold domain-containing protein n=1 Tax=Cohnella fermenti TaxID=2565925 RepID=A0A4V3WF32_9BACL|nr:BNR-4 repeat-containing protein [Cohnella fermenti]THF78741.1 hypothetical protein E6C55_13530 [Cohnella fermenti]
MGNVVRKKLAALTAALVLLMVLAPLTGAIGSGKAEAAGEQTVLYRDGFEDGFGDWTAAYGTPSSSAVRTHNGASSYAMDEDRDGLQRVWSSPVNGVAVVWFYDNASDMSLQAAAFADQSTTNVALGVFSATSATHYVYRVGSAFTATDVERTTGWHSFVFDYTSGTDVKLYIDRKLVQQSTSATALTRISLGDFWDSHTAAGSYFDDVSILAALPWEPAQLTPAATASAPELWLNEGFEDGFARWTTKHGTPSADTSVYRSGSSSYELDEDKDAIEFRTAAKLNKVAVVWMYDDLAVTPRAMAYADTYTSALSIIGLGLNAELSTSHYVYRIGTQETVSAVARTTGWHSLAFDYRSGSGVKLYIDGTLVVSGSEETGFKRIAVGDYWEDGRAGGVRFDDVTVQDWLPGETPKVTAAIDLEFSDSFENGFNSWTAAAGTPSMSQAQAHAGSRSYALDQDTDVIQLSLSAVANRAVTVWFYDDAADTSAQALAFADGNASSVALGVNTPTSTSQYIYRIGSVYTASGIARTTGWHSFGFDYRSGNGVTLYIDGAVVITSTAETSFKRIALGDYWAGSTGAFYYDDVSIGTSFEWETAASNPGAGFAEDFEQGTSAWTTLYGTPVVAPGRAYTGIRSYVLDEDLDAVEYDLPAAVQQTAVIRFYDPGSGDSQAMAYADGPLAQIGLGLDTSVSAGEYVFQAGGLTATTGISRTAGWHSLGFDYRSGVGVTLYIDGNEVAARTEESSLQRIALGDFQVGTVSDASFDAVQIGDYLPWETFLDSFEQGFGAWTTVSGTASTSTAHAHSGASSYAVDQDTDVIQISLSGLLNKTALVWFYDDAADTSASVMAFADGNSSTVALGVNTSTSPTQYAYRIGSTYTASGVTRTTGWHSFGFDYRSGTAVRLYIDGQQVADSTAEKSFKRIALGDYWTGSTAAVYFDDVRISDYFPWETAAAPYAPSAVSVADAFGFEAEGAWNSEAYVLEDNPTFKESQLIVSQTGSLSELNDGVSLSTEYVEQGTYSGRWANHPYYPTISTRDVPPDWSAYNSVSYSVYSEEATNETVTMLVFSDNPATYWKEFYSYTFHVDWTGWKSFELPFAAFSAYGDPAGWNSVQAIHFSTKAFDAQPNPNTVLYLDDISLHDRSEGELITLLAGLGGAPNDTVNYIVRYPENAGFENMRLDDYLLYVRNTLEYPSASPGRQLELASDNEALLLKYGTVSAAVYAPGQFVDTQSRIATVHDMVFDESVMNHPYSELETASPDPILYEPYWRTERALYGYYPKFNPNQVSIAPDGSRYIKVGNSRIETYNQEKDLWLELNIDPVYESYASEELGWSQFRHRDDAAYNDVNIRFDNDGDAYILAVIQRILDDGSRGEFASLLLHSRDGMKTWQVYRLPQKFAKFENMEANNQAALDRPPVITMHNGFVNTNDQGAYLLLPSKNVDGTLDLSEQIKYAEGVIDTSTKHSGDSNIAVTRGGKVYLIYGVMELENAPPIPDNHPASSVSWTKGSTTYYSKNGVPEYAVVYDLQTKQLSSPVFVGFGGSALDNHNWPVLSVDSEGTLHAFLNGHHDPVMYAASTSSEDISSWTIPEMVGTANSYASTVIDANDTVYLIARDSARGYKFDLTLYRKKAGQSWEPVKFLVQRSRSFYEVWNQKLSLDPYTGRLYLTYYSQSRQVQIYKDEYDAFQYMWPDRQMLTDPAGVNTPSGTTGTATKQYQTLNLKPSEPVTLISDDGGDTWHLAVSEDFAE